MRKIYATCLAALFVAINTFGQSTFSTVQSIMQANCSASGCHGGGNAQVFDVDASATDLYDALVDVPAVNLVAAEKGNKIVDPGHPYNSFLLRKIGSNGFDSYIQIEAAEKSSHPTVGLQNHEIELIRQWILAGAQETGTVTDYQLIQDYYANGGIDFIPVPAAPPVGKGFQVRYGPIFFAPSEEREIMKKEHLKNTDEIRVSQMDGYMSWESHHMLLFRFEGNDARSEPEGMRTVPIQAFPFNGGVLTGMWQNDGEFKLPQGTAFYWPAGTVLDFDYHVKNYSQTEILPSDFYMNIYYNEDPTPPIEMFAELDNQTLLALNQGLNFESRSHDFSEDRYLWLITSHTHKYATDYDIFLKESGGIKGEQIYEGFYNEDYTFNQGYYDYQHPANRYFEPMKKVDNGFIFETTWDVTGPCTSPLQPLFCITFGLTTDDEMMLFSYLYTKEKVTTTTGINEVSQSSVNLSVYPNPVQNGTEIRFNLALSANVTIDVFDVLGKKVTTLVEANFAAGNHSQDFSAAQIGTASGVYFVTLSIDGKSVATKKVTKL